MNTVVVTGASGYVGARFVEHTVARSDVEVRSIVRHARPWVRGRQIAVDLVADGAVEQLADAMAGADAVVHLAAPNEATPDPDVMLRDAVVGTRRVTEAASRSGVRRIVYLSTMHVYGDAAVDGATLTETVLPQPRHPYAIGRLASEHLVATGPDAVVLRLTNGVGAPIDPRVERWTLVTNDLAYQAATAGEIRLATAGDQSRDFCALDDVCTWLTTAALDVGQVPAGTYNVGAGSTRTIRELAELVADATEAATGTRPAVVAGTGGPGPANFRVDVSRAGAVGMIAATPLATAVAATVDACLQWFSPSRSDGGRMPTA